MKKVIITLFCCGLIIGMVGCGGNSAPSPTEKLPATVSKTVITETPTEITPPVTAAESTEKEKEPTPTGAGYGRQTADIADQNGKK